MIKDQINIVFAFMLCLIVPQLSAQDINAVFSETTILTDGELDEDVWQKAPRTDNFWQQFPADSIKALGETYVQMAYDDQNLYVAVTAHSKSNDFIVTSLRRDYSFRFSDNITLVIDTYGDQNNAFVFGLNAMGVTREALISNGGRDRGSFLSSWDNKWTGDSKIYEDYWIAEYSIPFNTLRFEKGANNWRFNCYRSETQYNEYSTLNRIPRNRIIMDLTYSSNVVFEEAPEGGGSNISIIPYLTASTVRDFENVDETKAKNSFDFGGDAKIAITSGLNLDLTANPDFSQVEVDQQQTNLGRFELFFPERRQFFLENSDLFSSFGAQRINPFFSRRIGIVRDTASGINIQNPILYGARLSGKLNDKLRLGLLNMQTSKDFANGLPSFNYTVATLQQRVFGRSNISAILVNKQAINEKDFSGDFNSYNRVAGLEYRLFSKDNRWIGKALYHHSFAQEKEDMPFFHMAQLEYQVRKYRFEWAHLLVGQGFDAEVGFVPRRDYFMMSPEFSLYFYPNGEVINQHTLNIDTRFFLQIGKDGNTIIDPWGGVEQEVEAEWELSFKNNTSIGLQTTYSNVTLLNDFDPTRVQEDDVFLPAGSRHSYISLQGSYASDQRKKVFFRVSPNVGSFFNGFRAGSRTSLTYQFQPYGSIALNANYNYVKLAEPFEPASIWLVGPKLDVTFTKNMYFTAFVQYNNQQDNLNINTRFQWRFAPVSDFFLVYTDNYLTEDFSQYSVRNRALVAKVTYWLNL